MRTIATMPVLTWITWGMMALIAAGIGMTWSLRIRLRWLPSLLVTAVSAAGTLAGLYLFCLSARPVPANVTITSPSSGSHVIGNRLQVSGTVSLPNSRVTLVVRSEKDLRWWVQSVVKAEEETVGINKWSINAYVGSPTAGSGESFQIIALASGDGYLFRLITGRLLDEGASLKNVPLWEQSEPIVVRRVN